MFTWLSLKMAEVTKAEDIKNMQKSIKYIRGSLVEDARVG